MKTPAVLDAFRTGVKINNAISTSICYNVIRIINLNFDKREAVVSKLFLSITIFCSLLIVVSGCSKSSQVLKKEPGAEVTHRTLTIKPGGSDEECIAVKPGKVFDYNFDASDFVNFNIHYHTEDEVKYPVHKKGVMFDKGNVDPGTQDFYTPEQEYYCLMWENPHEQKVKVSFTCVLKNK
jgi:hypothetical protein